jgi:hypothetical protein
MIGVGVHVFRGDKIARESVYAMEGFDAAPWRSEWATRFDPLASMSPAEWHEGIDYPIDTVPTASR